MSMNLYDERKRPRQMVQFTLILRVLFLVYIVYVYCTNDFSILCRPPKFPPKFLQRCLYPEVFLRKPAIFPAIELIILFETCTVHRKFFLPAHKLEPGRTLEGNIVLFTETSCKSITTFCSLQPCNN